MSIIATSPLNSHWQTLDPFLFSVHHLDHYPAGNEQLGPQPGVAGRRIGQDFAGKDGWNMYHGETVPGFPHHPHRGFETVTFVMNTQEEISLAFAEYRKTEFGGWPWPTAEFVHPRENGRFAVYPDGREEVR